MILQNGTYSSLEFYKDIIPKFPKSLKLQFIKIVLVSLPYLSSEI
jgi:hypothetical protein